MLPWLLVRVVVVGTLKRCLERLKESVLGEKGE